MKRIVAVALVLGLLAGAPSVSLAQTTGTGTVLMTAGDILLLRPFSFAATVVGFTLFAVGYPIVLITGKEGLWEDMVMKPFHATFTRCLNCDLIEDHEAP